MPPMKLWISRHARKREPASYIETGAASSPCCNAKIDV